MTKNEIVNDPSLMQRACSLFVARNVIYCVSTLMDELREVAENLDDYDTYLTLTGGVPRYEEAANYFIFQDADPGQLEEIAENEAYWDDVLLAAGVPENYWDEIEESEDMVDLDDYLTKHNLYDALRNAVWAVTTEYDWVCREFDLEPEYSEIYEHWICSKHLAELLRGQGQVVEEYMGMLVWGRATTGQSISIDHCVEAIVADLDANHWIWGEVS